jgi:hypothetical protein
MEGLELFRLLEGAVLLSLFIWFIVLALTVIVYWIVIVLPEYRNKRK